MSFAREMEKRLERLVDGISAALFGGKMQPADLANRLVREADLLVVEGPVGPEAPNRFTVEVDESDVDPELDLRALNRHLAEVLDGAAQDRGWRTPGPMTVNVVPNAGVGAGRIVCSAEAAPAPQPAWGHLIATEGAPAFPLAGNRVLVGRAEDADCLLSDPRVSRHHALIFREGGKVWIRDLGSANGTELNGRHITTDPEPVHPGDLVGIGPATFAFRMS